MILKQAENVDRSACSFDEVKCRLYNARRGGLRYYDCPVCKNKGFVMRPADGGTVMHECECMRERRIRKHIEACGCAGLLETHTLERFKAKEPWQAELRRAAEDYIAHGDGEWFFAGGQIGCGKTHICTAILGALLAAGEEAQVMFWRADSARLKANVNEPSYGEEMERLKTVPVLYIDDFFKSRSGDKPSGGDINLAFELLDARYVRSRRTIISSEKTMAQLLDIDPAIGSRIYERAKRYALNITPDDRKNWRLR